MVTAPPTLEIALNLALNPALDGKTRLQIAACGQWSQLPTPCDMVHTWTERTLNWLDQHPDAFWLALGQADYPANLLDLKNPPLVLFGHGDRHLLACRSVGVVGSRNATKVGLGHAQAMSKAFAQAGWVVTSGMAEGIDGAAHHGALDGQGGTIAVLGCGPDQVYPKHHRSLTERLLAHQGLLLSEYPPGTAPQPAFFPRRNRLIASQADALLVVEAAVKSGSLITAQVASRLGRPVFAMPGSVHSSQSRGCHAMIKQGAGLADCAADVLDEALAQLKPGRETHTAPMLQEADKTRGQAPGCMAEPTDGLDPASQATLAVLDGQAREVDHIARHCGLDEDDTLAALTELELAGLAVCEAGGRWVRVGPAGR